MPQGNSPAAYLFCAGNAFFERLSLDFLQEMMYNYLNVHIFELSVQNIPRNIARKGNIYAELQ